MSSETSNSLGLRLRKTPSLLELVTMVLAQQREGPNEGLDHLEKRKHSRHSGWEERKTSNIPALNLRIGSWEVTAKNAGDIVAKFYYLRGKVLYEMLDNGLRNKIEFKQSDISAIRATFRKHQPDILEVELKDKPEFAREDNPQPRKHASWRPICDFTGGQASFCRKHRLEFLEGTLVKHYEKLICANPQLYMLSQSPLPSLSPSFFMVIYNTDESDGSGPNMKLDGSTSTCFNSQTGHLVHPMPNSSLLQVGSCTSFMNSSCSGPSLNQRAGLRDLDPPSSDELSSALNLVQPIRATYSNPTSSVIHPAMGYQSEVNMNHLTSSSAFVFQHENGDLLTRQIMHVPQIQEAPMYAYSTSVPKSSYGNRLQIEELGNQRNFVNQSFSSNQEEPQNETGLHSQMQSIIPSAVLENPADYREINEEPNPADYREIIVGLNPEQNKGKEIIQSSGKDSPSTPLDFHFQSNFG